MPPQNNIDLSSGMVPIQQGIDLSAGLTTQSPADANATAQNLETSRQALHNMAEQEDRIGYSSIRGGANIEGATDKSSIVGGVGQRIWDTVKSLGSLVAPPQTSGEWAESILGMGPVGVAAHRLVKGFGQAERQAAQQVSQQWKAGDTAQSAITALSMLDPLAVGSVTNVNSLNQQGKYNEAIGQGGFDAASLASGTKLGGKVLNVGLRSVKVGLRGEQAITAAVNPKPTQIAPFRQAVRTVGTELAGADSLEGLRDLASQKRNAAGTAMENARNAA